MSCIKIARLTQKFIFFPLGILIFDPLVTDGSIPATNLGTWVSPALPASCSVPGIPRGLDTLEAQLLVQLCQHRC